MAKSAPVNNLTERITEERKQNFEEYPGVITVGEGTIPCESPRDIIFKAVEKGMDITEAAPVLERYDRSFNLRVHESPKGPSLAIYGMEASRVGYYKGKDWQYISGAVRHFGQINEYLGANNISGQWPPTENLPENVREPNISQEDIEEVFFRDRAPVVAFNQALDELQRTRPELGKGMELTRRIKETVLPHVLHRGDFEKVELSSDDTALRNKYPKRFAIHEDGSLWFAIRKGDFIGPAADSEYVPVAIDEIEGKLALVALEYNVVKDASRNYTLKLTRHDLTAALDGATEEGMPKFKAFGNMREGYTPTKVAQKTFREIKRGLGGIQKAIREDAIQPCWPKPYDTENLHEEIEMIKPGEVLRMPLYFELGGNHIVGQDAHKYKEVAEQLGYRQTHWSIDDRYEHMVYRPPEDILEAKTLIAETISRDAKGVVGAGHRGFEIAEVTRDRERDRLEIKLAVAEPARFIGTGGRNIKKITHRLEYIFGIEEGNVKINVSELE